MLPVRLLRPGILDSDRVDALSPQAEVFYRRLMSVVDDYGRFRADLRVLRSELYPLRPERITHQQVEAWLAECTQIIKGAEEPLITVYEVRGKKYLQIDNFGQRSRTKSKFPAPPEGTRERNSGPDVDNSPQSADRCPQPAARASNTSPSPNTPPNTNSNANAREKEGSSGVQAKLIGALRAAGFACCSELKMPDLQMKNGASVGLRVDVAVMSNGAPAFLIECKDYAKRENGSLRWELTLQYRKYAECGLPFGLCNGVEQIESTVQLVRETLGIPSEQAEQQAHFDQRELFEELVEAYPPAGRERLQQAYTAFIEAIATESKQRRLGQADVFREMLEGILRWQASERWQAGKVHLLKTFLAEGLWREKPVAAQAANRARAPASKREQGVAEFRRRLMRDVEEANENAGFVHGAGSDGGGR